MLFILPLIIVVAVVFNYNMPKPETPFINILHIKASCNYKLILYVLHLLEDQECKFISW